MKLQCKYCLTAFFGEDHSSNIYFNKAPTVSIDDSHYHLNINYTSVTCPNCSGAHIFLEHFLNDGQRILDNYLVVPNIGAFPPAPEQVPEALAQDYSEANLVLSFSPKASAALARRCLQGILTAAGYTSRNLVDQVEAAISEPSPAKSLPPALRDSVDAIRNFGNFSAHPLSDKTTLQIIDVEAGEAEWCLELLGSLFDHYYVKPAQAAERRASLAEKLSKAGKPPMKNGS